MTKPDDMDSPQDESGYALVMPFVICKSNGGPLEDHAFVIGYSLGKIDAELEICETLHSMPYPRYVRVEAVQQLDLIAMRYGFVLRLGEKDDSEEWQEVHFDKYLNDSGDLDE